MTNSTLRETLQFKLTPADNTKLANLCGIYDENIKAISKLLDVRINRSNEKFSITGIDDHPARARKLIQRLYQESDTAVDESRLSYFLSEPRSDRPSANPCGISPSNKTQKEYLNTIRSNDVTFGIGASGTGKTFLAMACALEALSQEAVRRIVLVRPAVEAGEHLGFLPGDPVQKVNPYLRPLLDALHEIPSNLKVDDHFSDNRIELAPLAFMRGRTLKDSFIILDEAQNTTCAQMQMFLTRIGHGSRCVVTGDESQVDLPRHQDSGLTDVLARIENIAGCAVTRFKSIDTLRHPVVARILKAYDQA